MWFPPVASTWIPRDIHQFCLLGIVPSWYMCHFCSIFLSMSEMWWSMYCELLCSRHFTHRHAKNKPHLKSVVFLYVEIQMHTEGNKIISYSMHQWFISPGSLKTDNAHPYLSLHISHPSQLCLCKWTQSKRYDRKIVSHDDSLTQCVGMFFYRLKAFSYLKFMWIPLRSLVHNLA